MGLQPQYLVPGCKDCATLVCGGNSIHGPYYEIKIMINFIDDNVFIVLYVSYVILLFKNILGTYVVMSSIFKTGQGVKLPMVGDFTY
jgi:hypothetical protein